MSYTTRKTINLPKVGVECPICEKETILASQYNNDSVYCRNCKIVWRKATEQEIRENQENKTKAINRLATKDDIAELGKKIDEIGTLLKKLILIIKK